MGLILAIAITAVAVLSNDAGQQVSQSTPETEQINITEILNQSINCEGTPRYSIGNNTVTCNPR